MCSFLRQIYSKHVRTKYGRVNQKVLLISMSFTQTKSCFHVIKISKFEPLVWKIEPKNFCFHTAPAHFLLCPEVRVKCYFTSTSMVCLTGRVKSSAVFWKEVTSDLRPLWIFSILFRLSATFCTRRQQKQTSVAFSKWPMLWLQDSMSLQHSFNLLSHLKPLNEHRKLL